MVNYYSLIRDFFVVFKHLVFNRSSNSHSANLNSNYVLPIPLARVVNKFRVRVLSFEIHVLERD